jgi:two-component system response regulator AtoC
MALFIPPLRERKTEIEGLVRLFSARACRQMQRAKVPSLSAEVLAILHRHTWPGNIRELRNVVDRAVVLCEGTTLLPQHLPPSLASGQTPRSIASGTPPGGEAPRRTSNPEPAARGDDEMERLRKEISALELERIRDALAKCAGNQTKAAELLGISRRTLVARLGEYDLPRPRKPS